MASGVEERSYVHRRREDFGGHGGGVSDVVKVHFLPLGCARGWLGRRELCRRKRMPLFLYL